MLFEPKTFKPSNTYITISGGSDSYYEYLLKTNILMEGKEDLQLDMWLTAVDSMQRYLRSETHSGKVYLGEFEGNYKLLQSGELVCFMPGNLLLGARYLNDRNLEFFANELMNSCYDVWNTATGLAPETWSWIDNQQDFDVFPEGMKKLMLKSGFVSQNTSYDLRPGKLNFFF
jgi:mannosyl-oligosaccharide alpha-1,2-mannosidase